MMANAIDMFDDLAQQQSFAELEAHPQQITIRTTADSKQVQIQISDNGKGMTEEVRTFDTKTGARITRAILPRWSEEWHLTDVKMPNVNAKKGRQCGQLVSRQFGSDRYNLPFVPCDLRHAWATRASVAKGLPVTTAASMMGHSVATHTRVYHRWLKDSENEKVYRSLILGEG